MQDRAFVSFVQKVKLLNLENRPYPDPPSGEQHGG